MSLTFWEHITSTHKFSWVDRKHHLNTLRNLVPGFESTNMRKVYLLGYAEANSSTLAKIMGCVQNKKACALKRVFNSLPYGEDELGLTVIGDMFAVYLVLTKSGEELIYINHTAARKIEFQGEVSGFPYYFLFGKSLVYPPLSLLS